MPYLGVWVPETVLRHKGLSPIEKLLFCHIAALDHEKGCFATNGYFAKVYNMDPTRISKIISRLSKRGYILVYHGRKRQIHVRWKPSSLPDHQPVPPSPWEQAPSAETARGLGAGGNQIEKEIINQGSLSNVKTAERRTRLDEALDLLRRKHRMWDVEKSYPDPNESAVIIQWLNAWEQQQRIIDEDEVRPMLRRLDENARLLHYDCTGEYVAWLMALPWYSFEIPTVEGLAERGMYPADRDTGWRPFDILSNLDVDEAPFFSEGVDDEPVISEEMGMAVQDEAASPSDPEADGAQACGRLENGLQ